MKKYKNPKMEIIAMSSKEDVLNSSQPYADDVDWEEPRCCL